jgi:hypothetical protein
MMEAGQAPATAQEKYFARWDNRQAKKGVGRRKSARREKPWLDMPTDPYKTLHIL